MFWFQFIISALVIVVAGSRLTIFADRLSDQLNLGKAMVGILLLGLITSLPEAVACIVSIHSLNADDMAVGNLLGSNNFNPLLIVVMDLVYRKGSVTNQIRTGSIHKLSAYYAIVLTAIVIFEILFELPSIGPISVGGVAILWIYFQGIRNLASISKTQHQTSENEVKQSLMHTIFGLLICAIFVVVAAIVLANSADTIAKETGLGGTFVGSIFLALVTSLPEMVVSLSALQMGAFDLAIGNIFGSNMSNIFILDLCSLVNPQGPILYDVKSVHIITAVFSIGMMLVAIAGIGQHKKKSFSGLGWDSWTMMMLFLIGTSILYQLR